jgi:TonB family protein
VALEAAPASVLRIQPVVLDGATSPATIPVDALLLGLWLVLSVACVAFVALAALRLQRARRTWERAELDGVGVLLSEDVGPAVVGLGRGEIVMPRWALRIDRGLRRLLLLHEREHVRAGDPWLLFGGLAAIVCAPWNPFVWLQFLRLRLAIEIDCDGRVLRASRDARGYGSLLLEVGRYRMEPALAVAFGEPRRFLEERIRMIPRALGRRHPARALALGLSASAVLLLAVCARDPMSSVDPMDRAAMVEPGAEATPDASAEPEFTPFTVPPKIRNAEETRVALESNYPPLLRDAGIGGTTLVWFFITETGLVQKVQVNKSSGYQALDEAALKIAAGIEFEPALNRDHPVPVWIAVPIVFSTRGDAALSMKRQEGDSAALAREAERRARFEEMQALRRKQEGAVEPTPEAGPQFTPFTDSPEIANRADVQRALESNYPPLLRDAGIGGETLVWFLIDDSGEVADLRINRSSGKPALDDAALAVARTMRFTPARNRGVAVPVWVAIPIVFTAK